MSDTVLLHVEQSVATITLNRPKALNGVNVELGQALRDTLLQVEQDVGVRVVVLRGAGAHFMGGGDVNTLESLLDMIPGEKAATIDEVVGCVSESIRCIQRMEKPVIACVEGAAAGFGLSLVCACDMAIAADNAFFTFAYTLIGCTPDGGTSFMLPRTIGVKRAMELAMLCDRIDAPHAEQLHIINRVVALAALEGELIGLTRRLAQGPTAVYAQTKALLNQASLHSLDQQLAIEADVFQRNTGTPEFAEGVRAFLEKRKPQFL